MSLTPEPTQAEIETTREVLALPSFDQARDLVNGLNQAQWDAQTADNATWLEARDETDAIKRVGSIEFFEPASSLTRIRNRSRFRFGLPALSGDATESDAQNGLNIFASTGKWF